MPCALFTLLLLGLVAFRFGLRVLTHTTLTHTARMERPAATGFSTPLALWAWVPLGSALFLPVLPLFGWLAVAVLASIVLAPTLWARWVTIPRGLARTTWLLGRISSLNWREDQSGAAYALGMWAWVRGTSSPAARAWLDARANATYPVTAGIVFGWALGRAQDGQGEQARQLVETIAFFDERYVPRPLQALSREWLVAEALERGDREAALAHLEPPGPRTGATRVLEALLQGLPEEEVRKAMAFAPRSWEHLHRWRELAQRRSRSTQVPSQGTDLDNALRQHLTLLATENPAPLQVHDVARAWDQVGELPPTLHADVVEDLSRRITEASAGGEGVLQEAGVLARNRIQAELELTCERLRARALAGNFHDPEAELLAFCHVRERYQVLSRLSGRSQRRVAWQGVHRALTPLAVRLYNERAQKPMSNAMTRWLLHEAQAVGDERGASLHADNLACFGSRR